MTFTENCYKILKTVPKGKVVTYKQIAEALGTKAYRAVGIAMNKNKCSFMNGGTIPCHRVINTDGSLGGFAFGIEAKKDLLEKEGVTITDNKISKEFLHKL